MMDSKFALLDGILSQMGSVAVAFSGGVDSSLLVKKAFDIFNMNAIALTAISPSMSKREFESACALAKRIGIRHITIETNEVEDPRYLENTTQRCYICKKIVYRILVDFATRHGYNFLIDGSNQDDIGDHRPGNLASTELGVRSPLIEAGLTKSEIRKLAREIGLPNWDKSSKACLSSRIPYGTTISIPMLSQIEFAEEGLWKLGLGQLRVRHHGYVARIEIKPTEFEILLSHRKRVIDHLHAAGYRYITLDLEGFRSGSLNKVLY